MVVENCRWKPSTSIRLATTLRACIVHVVLLTKSLWKRSRDACGFALSNGVQCHFNIFRSFNGVQCHFNSFTAVGYGTIWGKSGGWTWIQKFWNILQHLSFSGCRSVEYPAREELETTRNNHICGHHHRNDLSDFCLRADLQTSKSLLYIGPMVASGL